MVSRVAKQPIKIPDGVDVKIWKQRITVQGALGRISRTIHDRIEVVLNDGVLRVSIKQKEHSVYCPKELNALAGTARSIVQNMVRGVCDGFRKKLIMVGIGYRAKVQEQILNLTVGFSHPVDVKIPKNVVVETPSATEIVVKGLDCHMVGQVAAGIRAIRPPEPYKGKGIRYDDERVICRDTKKK
ncbi:50S ribosomal protein L6 [Coxiella endosymbiont of Amblyomma sculptum]|uniref:50S ribosomal protein L6 n=1 Tax=Coxiella endosymbiont of Amblyomma sculptum TaxID=2487929 RepID=UPI00132EC7C8|nr:50S ribosomal protein L6 [Coxiella endosymbiont of Amblyomma sculptum]QHG92701.1 50S ribosomal protein L6 [Coxiella endosymbiont of Amblyomma sculptum]